MAFSDDPPTIGAGTDTKMTTPDRIEDPLRAGAPWRPFVNAGVLAGLALGAYSLLIAFDFGPPGVRMAVDDLGLFVVEMAAALGILVAARGKTGQMRLAWLFLGISVAAAALAQVMWSMSEFVFGPETPYPSVTDLMGLG